MKIATRPVHGSEIQQLITNSRRITEQNEGNIEIYEDRDLSLIIEYFNQLIRGTEGSPDCPYSGAPLHSNGIFVRKVLPEILANFPTLEESMSRDFCIAHDFLGIKENTYDDFDSTILIYHFGERYNNDVQICSEIDDFKKQANSVFRSKGRMLTQAHSLHPSIPGKAVGFNSQNPMLVMKRMNLPDKTILSSDPIGTQAFNLRFKQTLKPVHMFFIGGDDDFI